MKNLGKKAFSLVELLVVITILSIISVVAYQNFWWATDKAISGRKISDIWTIETALQQFKVDKNYYPMPMDFDATKNIWWYNSWSNSQASNTLSVVYNWQEISSIASWNGWWKVMWIWANSANQIWAKWVIWYTNDFTKSYLSKDLYDPELWDIKVWTDTMVASKWIWRYVYAIYAQPKLPALWNKQMTSWSYYNIATSIKKKWSETYETYIVWDYDNASCEVKSDCTETLIWSSSDVLKNKQNQDVNKDTKAVNQWIPYPIKDFAK